MTAAPKMATHVCGLCGEKITAPEMQLFHFMKAHKKYCTPKKKSARQVAAEKAYDAREANGIGSPLSQQTYTGRMFLRSMEKVQSAIRIELDAAREDAPQIDRMISEGGRL